MDGSVFYFMGGALIAAAIVLSAIGIRGKGSFPPSKRAMAGILGLFFLLVAGTAAYAVANAAQEQDDRNKQRAEEQQAQGEVAQGEATQGAPQGAPAAGKPAGSSLDLTSPSDGQTMFEPTELMTNAGSVTLTYDNPSPVTHNIALEDDSGKKLGQSEDTTQGAVDLTLDLPPGQYTYFCSIPGHRQAGMEGTLIVQ